MVAVTNVTRGTPLAERAVLCVTWPWRLSGLMFRREFGPFDGLWFPACSSIHMFWVRFAIDLVWLDDTLTVVAVTPDVRPWTVKTVRGATSVLELPVGVVERSGTVVGDAVGLGGRAQLGHGRSE